MNVNFFVTCIGDALKSRMARDSVLLLEKLGCRVNFPEKQGCCGQPAINSGYIKEAIPGMKNLIAALEDNDDPIISPAGSCTYAVKSYPTYLADEPEWALRAESFRAYAGSHLLYRQQTGCGGRWCQPAGPRCVSSFL